MIYRQFLAMNLVIKATDEDGEFFLFRSLSPWAECTHRISHNALREHCCYPNRCMDMANEPEDHESSFYHFGHDYLKRSQDVPDGDS